MAEDEMVGSPCSPRDSQEAESSPTPQFKSINSLALSFLYSPTRTSIQTTGKTIALMRRTFVGKVMSLLFNMLSRKLETPRNVSCKDGLNKGQKWYGPNISKRY